MADKFKVLTLELVRVDVYDRLALGNLDLDHGVVVVASEQESIARGHGCPLSPQDCLGEVLLLELIVQFEVACVVLYDGLRLVAVERFAMGGHFGLDHVDHT